MRQRNGSFWGIAVLASLLGLLVLSGGAVAQAGVARGSGDEGGDFEAQGTNSDEATNEESEDVEAMGSEGETSQNGSGDRDCADFDSQEEAQNFFEQQGGQDGEDSNRLDADGDGQDGEDSNRLDADGDGQACEDFDFGEDFPEGGVETGLSGVTSGGPSGGSSVNVPLAAGGTALALLSLGLAALALRRRA